MGLSLNVVCAEAGIYSAVTKLLLNAEKLIVLCNTLTAAGCACLYLAGIESNSKVCNSCVGSFTRTVRSNSCVACLVSHFDSFKSLRNRADLIELDEDRVSAAKLDTLFKTLGVCNEQVVAYKLDLVSKLLCKLLPALPVLFIESVLNGDNGIFFNKLLPVSDKLLRGKLCACLGENIFALFAALPFA